MKIGVIIPAAGRGVRMGGTVAKQYLQLNGKAVIVHSVQAALATPGVVSVVLALSPDDVHGAHVLKEAGVDDPRLHITEGGDERQITVKHALEHDSLSSADVILIHDAVRPLATTALFELVAREAFDKGAVVPVLPVVDTVKEVVDGKVIRTVNRNTLRRAQTPQGFRLQVLRDAFQAPDEVVRSSTDDASLVEASGVDVYTCMGEPWNLKLTKPDDMRVAEQHLENVQ